MSRRPTFKKMHRSTKEVERDKARRQKNMSEIARINSLAMTLGMTYGQYVGRYLSERAKEVRK